MSALLRSGASLCLAVAALAALNGCKRQGADSATESAGNPVTDAATTPSSLAKAAEALNPLPGPKDQVSRIMDTFLAAKSYHVTMTTATAKGEMAMEMDFVAPDRYRMKTPMGTQYVVGDTMYMTMNGRTMKMPLPKGQMDSYRDTAKFAHHKATMTVDVLGNEAVDGQTATKYLVRNTQPNPSESMMWVGVDGYPLKVEVEGNPNGQIARTTIRYSRFNDPTITVEPPQ
jgi:hypothetical protein